MSSHEQFCQTPRNSIQEGYYATEPKSPRSDWISKEIPKDVVKKKKNYHWDQMVNDPLFESASIKMNEHDWILKDPPYYFWVRKII